jgi:multiple sugar transport system ATP-binding protein
MNEGHLEQVAAPQALYDHPANLFVAGFIGSPPMNLVGARVERGPDGLDLVVGSQRLALPFDVPDALRERAGGGAIVVGVRPEAIHHAPDGVPERHALQAPVLLVESLGSDLLVHTELDAPAVLTKDQLEVAREVGGDPAADLARARFTARLTPDLRVAPGDRVRLRVDVERLHYFDPDTTLALT